MKGIALIQSKLNLFKKRYYFSIAVRGLLLSASLLILYFLFAVTLENSFWLNTASRFVLFSLFILLSIACIYLFLRKPLVFWLRHKGLSDEDTASYLGQRIPVVKDRLLNLIQLGKSSQPSELAFASMAQKSAEFESVSFDDAVPISENRKYLRYALVPAAVVVLIFLINSRVITDSTNRIIHFDEKFSPQAPFNFMVLNSSLIAFRNENFTINIQMDGKAVPDEAYLISGDRRLKLSGRTDRQFSYTFNNLQQGLDFQIEAAGFYSTSFRILIKDRPELTAFSVQLQYPVYIHRKPESLFNTGNIEIPEGTTATWQMGAAHTSQALIQFDSDKIPAPFEASGNQSFTYSRRFVNSDQYEITLKNESSANKDKISYTISVIKDAYPEINLNTYRDSVFYRTLALGGNVSDDYGLTRLGVFYTVSGANGEKMKGGNFDLSLFPNQQQQSFFYAWAIDSLGLKPGERLDYYVEVWDNDGVNGRKATKTGIYTFQIPGKDELVSDINRSSSQTANDINSSVDKAKQLNNQLDELTRNLKGKQSVDWQDKQKIADILHQRQDLDKMIKDLQKENQELNEKKDAFTEQNERIKEKAEQIKKLIDELLDEKTRKLLDQLQELLKENSDPNQLKKMIDDLNKNSNNLEKELQRTLDLFKQLQYDFKFDQTLKQLKEQIASEKEIQNETRELKENDKGKKNNKESATAQQQDSSSTQSKNLSQNEKLAKDQETLKEDFQKTEDSLEELRDLNQKMNSDQNELPSKEDSKQIQDAQQQSQDNLQQNRQSQAKEAQQRAIDKMQEMQQQMENSQESTAMEIDTQNLESLRQILHGLIKLSFDQEGMMSAFGTLQQSDPRFNKLAEQELNLRDDSKILEDSLLSLAKRDPFMSSFVSRKVSEVNDHMDKSIDAYHSRNRPQVATEMQATMTSINDLALMLDDHYDMLMQMMANAKPSNKKGKKGNSPSISQLQQQLNDRIEQLKNGKKSGRELSEELAQMAAEQERIRKALQEMQEQMQQRQGGPLPGNDLPAKMEESELDLVNKQLTDELIQRQHQIMTRLLDAEKSMREQDTDNKRQAETAKDYDKEIPKAFEEYLKQKEKEIELLKTVPPRLYPFYKNEVNDYFKRINQ